MGFVEGVLISPLLGAPKSQIELIERCLDGMNDQQLVAIFEKFLRGNPERWHESAHVLFYATIVQTCRLNKEKKQ